MRCKDQQLGTNFQGSRWICFREICTSCKTGSCEPRRISDPGGFVRSERKSRRAGPVMWNGGNPGLIAQQRCLLVLRQLLGKECVAYIFSPLPSFHTHTHTSSSPNTNSSIPKKIIIKDGSIQSAVLWFTAIFQKVTVIQRIFKKSNNNNTWHGFLWGFKSALVLPFKSDTGGRNGLSLVRRREKEEWRYGETEGVGMGLGGSALHSDEIKWRLKCWLIVFRPFITCSVTQAL